LALLSAERFDFIFCDYSDPDEKEVLYKAREMEPDPGFIDMVRDENEASEAVQPRRIHKRQVRGAETFIPWEFNPRDVVVALARCLKSATPPPPMQPRDGPRPKRPERGLEEINSLADRISANDKPVLICGEPGTGRRTLARRIHDASARHKAGGQFREFQCPPMDCPIHGKRVIRAQRGGLFMGDL